jgi:hypothetical protein
LQRVLDAISRPPSSFDSWLRFLESDEPNRGDRDTTASMAAAIAEARFGLDAELVEQTLARVPNKMHPVIQALYARVGKPMANPTPTCNTPEDAEEKVVQRFQLLRWLSRLGR